MRILVTGGGSGGHITPTLAVAEALKSTTTPKPDITYVIERGSGYLERVAGASAVDRVRTIFAGKLRRYHGVALWRQLLDLPTVAKNCFDLLRTCIGFLQIFGTLLVHRPNVIFIKGGFVGVPVGLAAALLRIPYVTHDSDPVPGLANRLISRWATLHAVGAPTELYSYPKHKTRHTGIPLSPDFQAIDENTQTALKQKLGLSKSELALLVVGGGGGAREIDERMEQVAARLLRTFSNLHIFHIFGKLNEHLLTERYSTLPEAERGRVHALTFTDELHIYSGAADVIVTRAGATNLAEFATQGKACVVIPNAQLTGGHQSRNAALLADAKAAVVLTQTELRSTPDKLETALTKLLSDKGARQQLVVRFASFAKTTAAADVADLLKAIVVK